MREVITARLLMLPNFISLRRSAAWRLAVAVAVSFLPVQAPLRAAVEPGEILISEMNCAACHDPGTLKDRLASRPSPRLDAAHGVKATPQWLHDFLLNPQSENSGIMFDVMIVVLV
jgi:hypothetical protein